MGKLLSLARAVFSEDMNILRYKTKAGASKYEKIAIPALLAAVIMWAIGYYAYQIIGPLSAVGIVELLPIFFIVALSLFSLMEGIFKVQGILFECKDNDLLFSLPIPRRRIFAIRIAKLISFQLLFNALFMLPVFVVYAFTVQPGAGFYVFSFLMLLLTPLLPTALAVAIGYIVKSLSLQFRHKKVFQIVLTFAVLVGIVAIAFNSQNVLEVFIANAGNIADTAAEIYYPAGAYARLITNFNIGDLLGLLAISILPLAAVIYLCSIRYFKVISKVREKSSAHTRSTTITAKRSSATVALVCREISRFLSSPVFVINTLVGLVLLVVGVIVAAAGLDNLMVLFAGSETEFSLDEIYVALPTIYLCALVFMLCMTSITSSSISLEGKSFAITRSLPVSPLRILSSKVLASLLICLPFILVSDIIVIVRFPIEFIDVMVIIIASLAVPIFTGLVGVLVNLKYPKMNAMSDAEVVKQSASSMISVLIGMGASIVSVVLMSIFSQYFRVSIIVVVFYIIIDFILWRLLRSWGVKKFCDIEV